MHSLNNFLGEDFGFGQAIIHTSFFLIPGKSNEIQLPLPKNSSFCYSKILTFIVIFTGSSITKLKYISSQTPHKFELNLEKLQY